MLKATLLLLTALLLTPLAALRAADKPRPNIIVILADDKGGDSFNILPALRGEPLPEPIRKLTVLQGDTHDDALAVRSGSWKLIESKTARGGQKHQLYNLASAPAETKNIAAEQPDIVRELAAALSKVDENGRSRP